MICSYLQQPGVTFKGRCEGPRRHSIRTDASLCDGEGAVLNCDYGAPSASGIGCHRIGDRRISVGSGTTSDCQPRGIAGRSRRASARRRDGNRTARSATADVCISGRDRIDDARPLCKGTAIPPIVIVAERELASALGDTDMVTEPFPLPLNPGLMLAQALSDVADQEHPGDAETPIVIVSPATLAEAVIGLSVDRARLCYDRPRDQRAVGVALFCRGSERHGKRIGTGCGGLERGFAIRVGCQA